MLMLSIGVLAEKEVSSHSGLRGRELATVTAASTQQYRLNKGKAQWYKVQSGQMYYRYNYEQICDTMCANSHYPWRVQIQSGNAPMAVDTEGKKHTGALSIAGMFQKLQNDILDPNIKSLDATYDNDIGYPTQVTTVYSDGFVMTSRVFGFQFEADSPQGQLTANKNKWDQQHICDYDFTYFEEGPNPHAIQWPLLVKVRKCQPWKTYDRNGNQVNYLIPQTLEQYFYTIQRQLNKEGSFVDNEYSKRGYATNIDIVTPDIGEIKFHFCTFNDNVSPTY